MEPGDQSRLAAFGPGRNEVHPGQRLAGARIPDQERAGAGQEASVEHGIQPRHARAETPGSGRGEQRARLGERLQARGDDDAVSGDGELVTPGEVTHAAQLDHPQHAPLAGGDGFLQQVEDPIEVGGNVVGLLGMAVGQ